MEGSIGTERIWGRHLNLTGGMRHGILEKVTVLDEDVSVNTDERKPNLGHWGGLVHILEMKLFLWSWNKSRS